MKLFEQLSESCRMASSVKRWMALWSVLTSFLCFNSGTSLGQTAPPLPELIVQSGHSSFIHAIDVSPDGLLAATGSEDSSVRLWSLPSGTEVRRLTQGAIVKSIAFSPDGKLIAAQSYQTVKVWEVSSGILKRSWSYFASGPYTKTGIAFTMDSKRVVVGDMIRLFVWSIETGKIDHIELMQVGCFAHQPKTNLIAVCSGNDRVTVWNTDTYKVVATIGPATSTYEIDPQIAKAIREGLENLKVSSPDPSKIPNEPDGAMLINIDFSPDGKSIVTNHQDGSLRVWDIASGKQSAVTKAEVESDVAASPDNKTFATAFGDKVVIRALGNAEIERELNPPRSEFTYFGAFAAQNGPIAPMRFTPDDSYLIHASVSQGRLIIFDLRSSTAISTGKSSVPVDTAFTSSDGSYLYTLAGSRPRIWNLTASPSLTQLPEGGVSQMISSPNGKWIAWNLYDKFEVFESSPSPSVQYFIPLCHEGSVLNACESGFKNQAYIIGVSDDGTQVIYREAISPENMDFAEGSRSDIYAVNVHDRTIRLLFSLPASLMVSSGYSAKQNLIAFVLTPSMKATLQGLKSTPRRTVRLFDISTLKEIDGLSFPVATDAEIADMVSKTHEDNPENFSDLSRARIGMEKGFRDYDPTTAILFSPNGAYVASTFTFHGAALWHVVDRKLVLLTGPHMQPDGKPGSSPTAFGFSRDSRFLSVGWNDGKVKIFETENGRELNEWQAHDTSVSSLSFAANDRLLLSAGGDGAVRFWSLPDQQVMLTLLPDVNPYNWAAVSPRGLFDGGPDAWSRFLWRFSGTTSDVYPIEIYFRQYFHPELLRDFFSCVNGASQSCTALDPPNKLNQLDRRLPDIAITSVTEDPKHEGTVSVQVDVRAPKQLGKQSPSGAFDLRLFRDGQLVAQFPASGSNGHDLTADDLHSWRRNHRIKLRRDGELSVPFPNIRVSSRGDISTEFTAYAFNEDRVKSLTSRACEYKPKAATTAGPQAQSPTAFVVVMGVDANESHNLDLDSAVASAKVFSGLIQDKLQAQYSNIVEIPLYSELDDGTDQTKTQTATKKNLQSVLDLLADRPIDPKDRDQVDPKHLIHRARPDDTIVLYIASHGYESPDGRFFVIPFDTGENWGITEPLVTACLSRKPSGDTCAQAQDFLNHSISNADLAQWWDGVDAGSLIMILDTCHAGAVSGRDFRPAPLGENGFGQLAFDKGMVILAASQPAQIERTMWSNDASQLTLLAQAMQAASSDASSETIIRWIRNASFQLPLVVMQLSPRNRDAYTQTPMLFDFSAETKKAALEAGDPLRDLNIPKSN
jgi:WD40 repeat protein